MFASHYLLDMAIVYENCCALGPIVAAGLVIVRVTFVCCLSLFSLVCNFLASEGAQQIIDTVTQQ